MTFPKDYLRIYLLAAPCLFIGVLSNLGVYNLYASGFALLCFCMLLIVLINRKPYFSILIPTCFGFVWLCLSVLYLETGAYAPEIAEHTYANGSTSRLVTFLTIFLLTIFFTLPKKGKKKFCSNRKIETVIFFFYLLMIIGFVANGAVFGFPFFFLEQRFYYWGNHPLGTVFSKVLEFSGYLFLFVGWRIGHGEKSKLNFRFKIIHWKLIIISSILIGLLYSNKASYFLSIMLHLITGYLLATSFYHEKIELFKMLPIKRLLVIFFLIILVSLLSYRYVHGYLGEELTSQLLNRIFAMQGQLWWAIDNRGSGNLSITNILLKDREGGPYGIFLMMQEIMPANSFVFYFENRIPLTGGFPAVLSFCFPYPIIMVPLIVFGVFSGIIYSGTIKALTHGRYEFFLWVILLSSLSWLISLGSINVVTSPIFITASVTLFVSQLARRIVRPLFCKFLSARS